VCRCVSVSVCQCVSVSVCQCVVVSVCQCNSVSVCQCVSVSVCRCVIVSVCQCVSVSLLFVRFFLFLPLRRLSNCTQFSRIVCGNICWSHKCVRVYKCMCVCVYVCTCVRVNVFVSTHWHNHFSMLCVCFCVSVCGVHVFFCCLCRWVWGHDTQWYTVIHSDTQWYLRLAVIPQASHRGLASAATGSGSHTSGKQ